MKRILWILISAILVSSLLLVACGTDETQEVDSADTSGEAMVDGVTIDFRNGHYYAITTGTYPDSCTRISEIQQEIDGDTIKNSLSTAKPEDLMCAQMITPFGVELLLATGGLMPGEYTVDINGVNTTFKIGE